MKRVIFCGSRTFYNRQVIKNYLDHLRYKYPDESIIIIHGAADGADLMAGSLATEMGFAVERYPANWKGLGKSAGPIRNKQMLATGVDEVYAFVDKPLEQSRGSSHMVKIAQEADVPVTVVRVSNGTS
jgi:hypothetical protein